MVWQPPKAPRGVSDILPGEIGPWRTAETVARAACERYGYREMRVPLFESTDLYVRGMGEVTDVVEKEMFRVSGPEKARTSDDARAEDFSLRPEFTAGIVRAYREHNLDKAVGLVKVYAMGPLFRYERPQKGRLRQFHQINVEALGAKEPSADVECIALARDILAGLKITGTRVRLNSIGDDTPTCRGRYRALLRERLKDRLDTLCENCKTRYERNIFRVLDCKRCVDKTADLPAMADHLDAPAAAHFKAVREGLDRQGIPYEIDARLVRGFDYYTRTVFEFASPWLGAQDAIGGGGRYDKLIPDMGGPEAGACGFAMGMERILLAMEAVRASEAKARAASATEGGGAKPGAEEAAPISRPKAVYVAAFPDERCRAEALDVALRVRAAGVESDLDHEGKSVKAQLRSANKLGFGYVIVIGENELKSREASLKDMAAHTERKVALEDLARSILEAK